MQEFVLVRTHLLCEQIRLHIFPIFFTKGNNFYDDTSMFLWTMKHFQNGGHLLNERICSMKSKLFPLRVDPIENEGKNGNGRVTHSL